MAAITLLHESLLDPLFQAAADSIEQAIIHALFHATTVIGHNNQQRLALSDILAQTSIYPSFTSESL